MPTDRDFADWFERRNAGDLPALNPCFCTGKCRTLGYCPANPPAIPFVARVVERPRHRVKAWRKPNEDGKNREAMYRPYRGTLPPFWDGQTISRPAEPA